MEPDAHIHVPVVRERQEDQQGTKASFKLTSAQKGKKITVVVTAKKAYYTTCPRPQWRPLR